jgi:hypothetical protein
MSRATATGIRLKLPTPRFSRSLSPRVSSRGSFVHGWHAAKGEAYVDNYESCSRSYERTRTWARKRKANRDIAQKAPLPPSSRSARLAFISPRSVTGAVTQRNDPRVGTLNLCAADGPPDVSSAIAPRLASQSGGAFAFDPSRGREWHSFLNLFKAY